MLQGLLRTHSEYVVSGAGQLPAGVVQPQHLYSTTTSSSMGHGFYLCAGTQSEAASQGLLPFNGSATWRNVNPLFSNQSILSGADGMLRFSGGTCDPTLGTAENVALSSVSFDSASTTEATAPPALQPSSTTNGNSAAAITMHRNNLYQVLNGDCCRGRSVLHWLAKQSTFGGESMATVQHAALQAA